MECLVKHAQQPSAQAKGKCPFDHSQSTAHASTSGRDAPPVSDSRPNGQAGQSSQASESRGKCPFPHAATAGEQQTSSDPATCPIGYGPQPSSAEAPQTAQCPMGFSSADGPRMTEFHCVICKSLLYDCVQLGCSCKYCRNCVAAYNDCPLCGADVTSRKPDAELQGLVDQYVDAHAGTHDLFDLGSTGSSAKVTKSSHKSRSAFLLQLAVRSAAGGNYPAAIDRLGKCKAELLKQVDDEGNTAALCSQLGAVCGSEADCHRQLNQPDQAKACYKESVQHLQACQSQNAEITHPLSVSYNKLGDMEYGFGNVEAAEGWYQQGLSVRQQALSSSQTSPEPSQQLDVVVSMIKVADANQALGRQELAIYCFNKALELVTRVQQDCVKDTGASDKCESLLAFLKSRQQ